MVIDTSALVAILLREPERRSFIEAIEAADSPRMSVASIEVIPVDGEQGHLARSAYSRFGKGRHRAGLNLGDCFSYAAAVSLGGPLLCKGDDFIHTDVLIANPLQELSNQ
jgi:ribonuclease VapC